jgi:predicted PurR-regulated permease PerM
MSKPWSNAFRYWFLTLIVLCLAFFAYYIRVIYRPLIVAGLIAYLINPVVVWAAKHPRLSRTAIVNIVALGVLGIVIAIPSIFLPNLISEIETLSIDLREIYATILDYLSTPVFVLGLSFEPQLLLPNTEDIPFLDVGFLTGEAFHLIESLSRNVLWLLALSAVIYFLLLDWDKIKYIFLNMAPLDYQDDFRKLYHAVRDIWGGYLRGNLILMLITGVVFSIVWSIIGLPAGLLLGIILGLFTIVPDIGPLTGGLLAVLMAFFEGSLVFTQMSNFWFGVLVFVVYFVLINIKNIWVRSVLFGKSVNMHEGLVFILIMLAVIVEGVLGALIIVPLVASAEKLGKYALAKLYHQDPFPEEAE